MGRTVPTVDARGETGDEAPCLAVGQRAMIAATMANLKRGGTLRSAIGKAVACCLR